MLVTFADLRVLFRGVRDEAEADLQVRAPQEHLHAYLRSLDVEGEGLPAPFLAALRRALGHYGVDDLERTPALEEALYWIYQSQQRVAAQIPVVVDILERWLEQGPQGDGDRRRAAQAPWTPWSRPPSGATRSSPTSPVRSASASSTNPGCAPPVTRMYEAMEGHLAALVADPARRERDAHMAALVDCPQPLAPLLLRRVAVDVPATRPVVLEAMTPPLLPPPGSPRRAASHRRRARHRRGRDDLGAGGGAHARAHHRRPAGRAGRRRPRPRRRRRPRSRPARR